ncbi:MAG: Gfo/Idh/MocA family oxidoreductase [Spirochaetes bacterium]|nr:Gfo/Idh/MocA family oxidoreductase [Spirochaetota bacterium]
MEPVRIGIIGCGVIGTGSHLPEAADSKLVTVTAVADIIEERVKNAAGRFNIQKTYASGDELIDDPSIEAVVLAMPAGDRFALARRALAKKKHVLLEKPAVRTLAEMRTLMAERGDRVVACCSPRFLAAPSAQAARQCVSEGTLGDLRVVRARAVLAAGPAPKNPPPPWRVSHERNGGGILVNWGCYDLDYLFGITGWKLRPERVSAKVWPLAEHLKSRVDPCSDAENHFAALIHCQNGTVISFERGEFVSAATDQAWQILGSKGSLRMHMLAGRNKELYLDRSSADGVATDVIWRGDEEKLQNTRYVLEDFATAIRTGSTPLTPLEHSLILQQITDAVYASAREGREIVIER